MKQSKIEVYAVILISIVAAFIFLPKIGASAPGRYLSRFAISSSGSIYGINYQGLLLTIGFLGALILTFGLMNEIERESNKFLKEAKIRLLEPEE